MSRLFQLRNIGLTNTSDLSNRQWMKELVLWYTGYGKSLLYKNSHEWGTPDELDKDKQKKLDNVLVRINADYAR